MFDLQVQPSMVPLNLCRECDGATASQLSSSPKCVCARVCVCDLSTKTILIIPGYAVNGNNFLFDKLLFKSVKRLPSRFCDVAR